MVGADLYRFQTNLVGKNQRQVTAITWLKKSKGFVAGAMTGFPGQGIVPLCFLVYKLGSALDATSQHRSAVFRGSSQSTRVWHGASALKVRTDGNSFNTWGHFKAVESDMSSSIGDQYHMTSFSFMTPVSLSFFFFFWTLS